MNFSSSAPPMGGQQPLSPPGTAVNPSLGLPNMTTMMNNNALTPTQLQLPLGLLVPGGLVRTDFAVIDPISHKWAISLTCPGDLPVPLASVTELVVFLLPGISLPPDQGILIYWQMETIPTYPGEPVASTGFELLGALTPNTPSQVLATGWSEHEQVVQASSSVSSSLRVNLGLSMEPVVNIQNLLLGSNKKDHRLFVAQKIALDLFKFMQSFDTGTAASSGQMVVPVNIFDRWFQRFENRFRRDPNFFLKSSNDF